MPNLPDESSLEALRPKSHVIFVLDGQPFGIDINLVHSFMPAGRSTPNRDIHPGLSGFFTTSQNAGNRLPLLNLAYLLGKKESPSATTVMLCEWNHALIAFRVDKIAGIYDLGLPNPVTAGCQSVPDFLLNSTEILLPDFQTLTSSLFQELRQRQKAARQQKHILLVHNSALLREVLTTALRTSGYVNLTELCDYSQAYSYIFRQYASGCPFDLLIMGSTSHPLADLDSLIAAINASLHFRTLPAILLTDQINLTQPPAIDAQLNPFNFVELVEQSDFLTGCTYLPGCE